MLGLSLIQITPRHLLSVPRAGSLAIVDTVGREPALYSPVMDIAREIGMTVDYMGFDQVMDTVSLPQQLASYQGVLILCGLEFIRGIYAKSPVAHKILSGIQAYARIPGVTVGLAFPPFLGKVNRNIIKELAPIFAALGLQVPHQEPLKRPAFKKPRSHSEVQHNHHWLMYSVNRFLTNPIEGKMRPYHTTLSVPRPFSAFFTMGSHLSAVLKQNNIIHLPREEFKLNTVLHTKPYGLTWYNAERGNNLLITTTTLCSFSGIAESFHVCPTSFTKRKDMLHGVAAMMRDIKGMIGSKSVRGVQAHTLPSLGSIEKFGKPLKSDFSASPFRKIAWMELAMFEDKDYEKKLSREEVDADRADRERRQDKLVSYIFDAGLDTLWISLTPNLYFSRIAKFRNRRERFIQSIARFTQKLRIEAVTRSLKLPAIIVGIEIADNLYEPHLPRSPAFDLYGGIYKDVPSPTDNNFWLHEVIEPLQMFVDQWKNPAISHGVKLGGVMLDLEMYCRKRTGNFLSTMGFARPLVAKFLQLKGIKSQPNSIHGVTSLLVERGLAQQYYAFLEQEARDIGRKIRTAVHQLLPEAVIGCYAPMILVDWFYKGLWQELSSKKRPMQLLTFNAEFNAHQGWFSANDIQVHHASVLLLSKIRSSKNFSWVKDILAHHDGVWLNRFSRLVEDYAPRSWVSVEQTPMKDDQKKEFFDYLDKLP